MNYNFAFYLTLAVAITGLITILNKFFWSKSRSASKKEPVLIEYARSFFPILLIVWVIRSFIVQPYRVPTGSLEPTIIPGDFIAVNQFAYGLHFPVLHTVNHSATILHVGTPRRGDIALFFWPLHPHIILVKRVIGVPGDHISYHNKVLTINGHICKQKLISTAYDYYYGAAPEPVELRTEDLLGKQHNIWIQPQGGETGSFDITVPKAEYFMMGDNRDASDDSRSWGFAPESSFIGKAEMVFMSWNPLLKKVRWGRIGTKL